MSGTPYNGLAANIALPTAINITSSTNTTPVVVQTSAPHGCKTGDYVDVSGHATNTAANGVWQVVVNDATHIQLTGAVGNGVGGATGTVTSQSFTGNVSLNPANGDPYDASTFIPGMSCLADRTAWSALMTGAYKIANIFMSLPATSDSNTLWAQQTGVSAFWTPPNVLPNISISGVQIGDLLLIDWTMTGSCSAGGGASLALFGIMEAGVAPGAAAPAAGAYAKLGGSNQGIVPGTNIFPMTLRARTQFGGGFNGSIVYLSPGFYAVGGTGSSFSLQGDSYLEVKVMRPTGKLQ